MIYFNRKQADRIANAVKAVEGEPDDRTGTPNQSHGNKQPFWASIVDYNSTTERYTWAKQKYSPTGSLVDAVPLGGNAYEVNGTVVGKDTNVLLFYAGTTGAGTTGATPLYAFQAPNPYALGAVKVTQTGGAAGSASTTCTYTYTVHDLSLNVLGLTMTPQKRRPANVKMSAPAANSIGTAYTDNNGTFQLYDPNEVPVTEACPT